MMRQLLVPVVAICMALPASADPYRLGIGDRVIVNHDFLDEPKPTQVDLDGNIRLSGIGSIAAEGLTLDEIETAVSHKMSQGGFSGVSFVLAEIAEYAPIVVSGYVARSGRFDFLPGMDVGAALAVAGGVGSGDLPGANSEVLAVNARRRATSAMASIVDAVADIARLEAALAGPDAEIALEPALREAVPPARREGLDARLAAEAAQLAEARRTAAMLVASWSSDIADFEEQTLLLDERITVKEASIANLAGELADIESLRTQGLATTSRLSALQQRLSDDREELLSLQTAKIAARRAASLAARSRDRYLAERRAEDLAALEQARNALIAGRQDYGFAIDELTALRAVAIAEEELLIEVRYSIRGPRAGRFGETEVTAESALLPGDILVVDLLDASAMTR